MHFYLFYPRSKHLMDLYLRGYKFQSPNIAIHYLLFKILRGDSLIELELT